MKVFFYFEILFFLAVGCCNIYAGLSFSFIVDSDIHIGKDSQQTVKAYHKEQIVDFIKNSLNHCRGVLISGDMVDSGGDVGQLNTFINSWVTPINNAFSFMDFRRKHQRNVKWITIHK